MAKVLEDILINTVCFLYNKNLEDNLGITSDEIEGKMIFAISQIAYVRQAADEGDILTDRCMVYFKSGDSVLIGMSYKEMAKLYENYYTEK